MSKILHHFDDDGRCAAFIVKQYMIGGLEMVVPEDLIEYNNSGNLENKYPRIRENETVYIVDIALSDAVYGFIKYVLDNGAKKIIHIDHHISGIEYLDSHRDVLNPLIEEGKYVPFLKNGISGTMLCWIYATVFNDEDKLYPMAASFDFDDDALRNKVCRVQDGNPVSVNGTPITDKMIPDIPDVVRFIDDNDVFKHKIPETKMFSWGFKLQPTKHPLAQIWVELFNDGDRVLQNKIIKDIITVGETIVRYREINDARILGSGFLVNINDIEICCLNTPDGNSFIFQEMYDHTDAVCKYNFDGEKYWYTFYSDNSTGADCLGIVRYLEKNFGKQYGFVSGGGHRNAAGCMFTKNILDAFEINKAEFIEKRKQIKVDLRVALEEKRLKEEEAKLKKEQERIAALRAKVLGQTDDEEDYGI